VPAGEIAERARELKPERAQLAERRHRHGHTSAAYIVEGRAASPPRRDFTSALQSIPRYAMARQQFSVIGRSLRRPDGPQKVSGLTRFAGDVRLPGMAHARLVVSPHAHARILSIESKAAAALPGVLGVFTGRDLPIAKPDPGSRNRSPLAHDRVVFNGHPSSPSWLKPRRAPKTRRRWWRSSTRSSPR
jgi:hypothetical protein